MAERTAIKIICEIAKDKEKLFFLVRARRRYVINIKNANPIPVIMIAAPNVIFYFFMLTR